MVGLNGAELSRIYNYFSLHNRLFLLLWQHKYILFKKENLQWNKQMQLLIQ